MPVPVTEILNAYDDQAQLLASYTDDLRGLLKRVIREQDLRVSQVGARLKKRSDLHDKLLRETATYRELYDVTDVVGARVITFFPDEVDEVASIIESQFEIDARNSVDKRAALDPDRFGYLSLHYVARLTSERTRLTEWQPFEGIPFEIQIRTLLQHTWAEIEHDLGYKTAEAIPRAVRRRFSRLAGVLELADLEFEGIRKDLGDYHSAVRASIRSRPDDVTLDQASLATLVVTNKTIQNLDNTIAERHFARLDRSPDYLGRRSVALQALGLANLSDVSDAIEVRSTHIPPFADEWLSADRYEALRQGISLFFLALVLFAERGAPAELADVLGLRPGEPERVLKIFRKLTRDSGQ